MALANKTAVVFGGSRGIGHAIGVELLKAGVTKLFVTDVLDLPEDERQELQQANGHAEVFFARCDVADRQQVSDLLKKDALNKLGTIDILVNSAGISDETDWQRLIVINLVGVMNSTLAGIEVMSRSHGGNGGTIVNISSVGGLVPFAGLPIYGASKWGIIGFMRSLEESADFPSYGLKLATVCPGGTSTKMPASAKSVLPMFQAVYKTLLANSSFQDASAVGQCVVRSILEGESGSTWISIDGTCKVHDFPTIALN